MRVLWSALLPTGSVRARAYSIDAVCEELLFTTGPLIAAAVISAASPAAGLLVTAAVAVVGTLGMTSSPLSRRHIAVATPPPTSARPLRQPGFVPVLVALVAVGVVLGTVEVAAPAFAVDLGSVELAGLLLAAFAAGSAFGGLLYGRRTWKSSVVHRLLIAGAAMIALSALLPVMPSTLLLGIGLAAVGFFLAPSLVTGYLLTDELTTPEVRTEASSWINTAVNTGAAAAAAGVGIAVDAIQPALGFLVGASFAFILLAVATPRLLVASRKLKTAQILSLAEGVGLERPS